MKVNGYEIEPMSAWYMESGNVAIITKVEDDRDTISGFVHISPDGRLGQVYWRPSGETKHLQYEPFKLISPVCHSDPLSEIMLFIPVREADSRQQKIKWLEQDHA